MGETVYVHRDRGNTLGIIFSKPDEEPAICWTGLEYQTERRDQRTEPLISGLAALGGIVMLTEKPEPPLPCYSVPWLCVFAGDGQGGYFAVAEDHPDRKGAAPVFHLDRKLVPRFAAESIHELFCAAVLDPDWRQKRLAGGAWPTLPQEPSGRAELAEAMGLEHKKPKEWEDPSSLPLPRIFPSRQAAEAELSIKDFWELAPAARFAIRKMKPEDYDGKGYVHYQAWQESYRGIMDDRILDGRTLEYCQKLANRYPENTLVLIDRAEKDQVIGFTCYLDEARDFVSLPNASEVAAIYLLEKYKGMGLGRRLMEAALSRLPHPAVALFVLKDNARAIGFYEHMGFRFTGHQQTEKIHDAEIVELEMVLQR